MVTAGAAQAMAKGERIAIGERVVIAGAGPFLFPVTDSLQKSGSTVVGVYEAAGIRRLARHWLARPWELRSATSKMAELAGYVGTHLRGRIPVPARLGRRRDQRHRPRRVGHRGQARRAVATRRRHRTHRRVRRGVPGTRLHPATGTSHCRGLRAQPRPIRHRGRRPAHQRAVGVRRRRDHRDRRGGSRAGRRRNRRLGGRRWRAHRLATRGRGARPCGVHAIRAPDRRRAPHRVGVDRLARTVDGGLPLRRGRLRHAAGGPP